MFFMQKGVCIKNLIFSLCLIIPLSAFASGDFVEILNRDGSSTMHRVRYHRGRQFTTIDYEETYRVNKMRRDAYEAYKRSNLPVRSPAGVMTQGTVSANVSRYVSKKTVTDAVWKGAKTIGKGAFRLANPLAKAYLAWEIVNSLAMNEGFTWDDKQQEWIKQVDNQVYKIIITNEADSFYGIQTEASLDEWCSRPNSGLYSFIGMGTAGGTRSCEPIGYIEGSQNVDAALKEACRSIGGNGKMNAHGLCLRDDPKTGSSNLLMPKAVKAVAMGKNLPFQYSDFNEVAEAAADAAVQKWIIAGQLSDSDFSEPEVLILDGEKAVTPPYTDPATGKAVQAEYDFYDVSDPGTGRVTTGVTEKIKERPDLTPDSPEAPLPNPNTGTGTGTGTGTNTGTGTGNDDKDKQSEQSDLCKEHPDILACDKQPGAEKEKDLPEIPKEKINVRFQVDNVFPNSGTCPQPVSFQAFGNTFSFSLQPACDLAVMIRPLIIAFAWLVAAFFVVKTIRSEA